MFGSIQVLKDRKLSIQSNKCPHLATAKALRTAINEDEFLPRRGKHDLVIRGTQGLIGRRRTKRQVSQCWTGPADVCTGRNDVDVCWANAGGCIYDTQPDVTRRGRGIVVGEHERGNRRRKIGGNDGRTATGTETYVLVN